MHSSGKDSLSVRDIAEMAGVSVATVSRVINQNGRFSKETEERVREIIRKYDYQPNQLARGLRVSKAKVIGILVPDITNEFFANITLELQRRLLARDYLTLICNTNENRELEAKQFNMLRAQRVAGIIYVSDGTGATAVPAAKADIPVVYIDRRPHAFQTDAETVFIESDNTMGGYLAAKALIDLGCRSIACVSYRDDISTYANRVKGYRDALREVGLRENICYANQPSADEGARALRHLWDRNPDLDAAFCTADMLAVGAVAFCTSCGLAIPKDFRIIGFDDTSVCQAVWPHLTTVRQSVEQFGAHAVEAILDLIEGRELSKTHYQIPVELIRRETT